MLKKYARPGMLLLTFAVAGCTAMPAAKNAEHADTTPRPTTERARVAVPSETGEPIRETPTEPLALLRVEAGALVTQVNGDPRLRCTQADCTIPLPAGKHRFTVGYKATETRAGSTVTYASMYPRVIEVTLESGHRYSLSASGRYSQKWSISIEDDTANKVVYNDAGANSSKSPR